MRKLFALLACLLLTASIQAQTTELKENFTTGLDIFNDLVMDEPDSVNFRGFNPGVNLYGMYSYEIPKSNLSLAIGLGLGMHNLHSDAALMDTSSVSFFAPYADGVDYKINKLQLTYIDLPAEIRFKSEKGFRFAIGIKAGYLLSAHTKYKGDNPDGGRSIKIKEGKLSNLEKWRFGPTMQIGYKWINLMGYYSLSTVFDEASGPAIFPVSIGIALRPF
ncbi:MAG TPA: outer membrane beta-barrel protein [Lentimicrobium sp.]|nr:outer membrane beta-barrel protein [Lentimicrobium sp.]